MAIYLTEATFIFVPKAVTANASAVSLYMRLSSTKTITVSTAAALAMFRVPPSRISLLAQPQRDSIDMCCITACRAAGEMVHRPATSCLISTNTNPGSFPECFVYLLKLHPTRHVPTECFGTGRKQKALSHNM